MLILGSTGWKLEYFGRDVAILRASLSREAGGGGGGGNIVLACAGSQRRLTLSLPGGLPGLTPRNGAESPYGALLIRGFPRGSGDPFVIVPVRLAQAGTFSFANEAGQGGEPVLSFARLLLDHPGRLDLLLRDGSGPVAFGSLTPLQVSVSWRPDDEIAFRGFLASCAGPSPRR